MTVDLYFSRPAGGRGMKLGKTKDVETFVDQLKSEGERMFISLFMLHFNTPAFFLIRRRLSFTLEDLYINIWVRI